LQGFDICRRGKGQNWFHVGRERNKAVGRDLMAKESDLLLSEQALVRIDVEAIFCQDGKDLL
jgi:hypothetical protein